MPSLWPFSSSSKSSASGFEKQLSALSTRITRFSSQSDLLRTRQRRYKALTTIYGSFAYILITAILVLVTGWQEWRAPEYSAVLGSPVLLYGLRQLLDLWYNYRLSNAQSKLEEAQTEREEVIRKLKAATKYDSTQELLEKYGGAPKQQRGKSPQPGGVKRKPSSGRQSLPAQLQQGQRTGFAPPPTANIPSRQTPPQQQLGPPDARPRSAQAANPQPPSPSETFAPNAFTSPQRPPPSIRPGNASYSSAQSAAWYDRILDIIVGEDESQAKNRFALICFQCRLVNGQAPPGAKSLEDVGIWRCRECGARNGVESEVGQMIRVVASPVSPTSPVSPSPPIEHVSERAEAVKEEDLEAEEEDLEDTDGASDDLAAITTGTSPAAGTRSKARQRKKA
ncbi:hypothetical protein B0A48_12955 [Cryoendolithus antarcticus]|uniref:Endoplasmic reticulum junction formation protein lunapark n=1 Tax=Cryoendolithus antarcticus TaxID=1507870 RepID=A0A1V8SQQ3_9PEZI|nr:hypothetical protein B0A48_12955 [Cryoendolithus antarcticus]